MTNEKLPEPGPAVGRDAVDPTGLMAAIRGELDHAYAKHGRDPWGRHEFYAILLEEVEELWAEIKADAPQEKVLAELRQVAAMCFRYAETGDRYRGEHPAIPQRTLPSAATAALIAASPLGDGFADPSTTREGT